MWDAMRHSGTRSANGENGLNSGFMHHAVWRMGGVNGKQEAALRQSQGAESQTSLLTLMDSGHNVNFSATWGYLSGRYIS